MVLSKAQQLASKPKDKKCGKCKKELPLQMFTSKRAKHCVTCTIKKGFEQAQASKDRQIERLKNKKQKTRDIIRISDLKKQVQKKFNKWIRERDDGQPCLACGKHSGKMDASHYISQGSSGFLRYDEYNVHNTCYACNRFKHGNLIGFRIGLVKKIGEDQVKRLEELRFKTWKWTREELENILESLK